MACLQRAKTIVLLNRQKQHLPKALLTHSVVDPVVLIFLMESNQVIKPKRPKSVVVLIYISTLSLLEMPASL